MVKSTGKSWLAIALLALLMLLLLLVLDVGFFAGRLGSLLAIPFEGQELYLSSTVSSLLQPYIDRRTVIRG